MKKTQPALQGKPRRLSLNRETIRVLNHPALLNNPALLELVRAGRPGTDTTDTTLTMTLPTQESTSQRTDTGTNTGC